MRQTTRSKLLSIALVLLSPGMAFANGAEQIGTILTTQGVVTARNAAGETRTLERRAHVFTGDTLIVSKEGFASLRMADNAHLSLGYDTEFSFEKYRFDANARDSVVMRLDRGCFRARVGQAGRGKRDEYRVETPVANITIAGSFHGATLVGDRLYTSTWDGTTTVSNSLGSVKLGGYGEPEHSRTLPGEAPQGMRALMPEAECKPPEALDGILPDYTGTVTE